MDDTLGTDENVLSVKRDDRGILFAGSNLRAHNREMGVNMKYTNIYDAKGIPFSKPSFWLNPKEYGKICSEINQIYEVQYKNKRIATHASFGIDGKAYVYWFENHGFDNYNIFMKVVDNH